MSLPLPRLLARALAPLPLLAALVALPAARAEAPDHTFEVKVAPATTPSQPGTVTFVITPAAPWKWNAEYPAKLTLTPAAGITVGKAVLKNQEGDFSNKDKRISAATTFSGAAAGAIATVTGKFGLCNDNVCIIKKVETTAKLDGAR